MACEAETQNSDLQQPCHDAAKWPRTVIFQANMQHTENQVSWLHLVTSGFWNGLHHLFEAGSLLSRVLVLPEEVDIEPRQEATEGFSNTGIVCET